MGRVEEEEEEERGREESGEDSNSEEEEEPVGSEDIKIWRERMLDVDEKTIKRTMKSVRRMGKTRRREAGEIETRARMVKVPREKETEVAKERGERIVTDVCTWREKGFGGERFAAHFFDEATGYGRVFGMKRKNEVGRCWKQFLADAAKAGVVVREVRLDGGREYFGRYYDEGFSGICADHQPPIQLERSPPRTSWWNGVAERRWRTIQQDSVALLVRAELPQRYWPFAVEEGVAKRNRLVRRGEELTLLERWSGEKPDMKREVVFGCGGFALVRAEVRDKSEERAVPCVYLGRDQVQKGKRVLMPDTGKIMFVQNVCLDETVSGGEMLLKVKRREKKRNLIKEADGELNSLDKEKPETSGSRPVVLSRVNPKEEDSEREEEKRIEEEEIQSSEEEEEEKQWEVEEIVKYDGRKKKYLVQWKAGDRSWEKESQFEEEDSEGEIVVNSILEEFKQKEREEEEKKKVGESRKEKRKRLQEEREREGLRRSKRAEAQKRREYVAMGKESVLELEGGKSPTFEQAMRRPDKGKWVEAIQEEIANWRRCGVFRELEREEKERRRVKSRWVLVIQKKGVEEKLRYKARLVAKGFTQIEGIDYTNTFAPTGSATAVRLAIAKAARERKKIRLADIKAAYLNAKLDVPIVMEWPSGSLGMLEGVEGEAVMLLKGVYGLKQAANLWNSELDSSLRERQYLPNVLEPCVYRNEEGELVVVWVDDLISVEKEDGDGVIEKLSDRYVVNETTNQEKILGVQIEEREDGIKLSQELYVEEVLRVMGMEECNPRSTPMEVETEKSRWKEVEERESLGWKPVAYREVVGMVNYLATWTRPDIAYAVSRVAEACNDPSEADWRRVVALLRYLRGTKRMGLFYSRRGEKVGEKLEVMVDADFANCVESRISRSGVVVFVGEAVVSWKSGKQGMVASTTTEAEMIALYDGVREAKYVCEVASFMNGKRIEVEVKHGMKEIGNVKFRGDNKSVVDMFRNPRTKKRKYIDVKCMKVVDEARRSGWELEKIPTAENIADCMTKSLGRVRFEKLREELVRG